jgi:hypothetical protein
MTSESSSAAAGSAGTLAAASPGAPRGWAKAVLGVTAIAGTLDIIAAHLHAWAASGKAPVTLLKRIAGGALGRERALQGGAETMALGLFFHYVIAFAFTVLFFLLYPRLSLLRKNGFAVGFAYAVFVWCTMNFIVLPLSALPRATPNFASKHTYIGIGILVIAIGIPIAAGAARFYRRSPPNRPAADA